MRPEVRIVQDQEVTNSPVDVNGWEAEQLLRKYGHTDQQFSTKPQVEEPISNNLTFEEMVAQQEAKDRNELLRKQQQQNGPKPITFNGSNGYDSTTTYGSDTDSGFGFKIEITTDMNIPRY